MPPAQVLIMAITCVGKEVASPPLLDAAALQALVTGRDGSVVYANAADIMLTDPFNNATPNLKPASGSPALTTPGKYDFGALSNAFFEHVNYVGAFDGTNDWTSGWAVFNK